MANRRVRLFRRSVEVQAHSEVVKGPALFKIYFKRFCLDHVLYKKKFTIQ